MIASSRGAAPRVVVTGIGLRTGLGPDAESTWAAIRAGKSAAAALGSDRERDGPRWFGFPAPGDAPEALGPAVREAVDALEDARLLDRGQPEFDRDRAATVIGLSKGDLGRLARIHRRWRSGAASSIDDHADDWTDAWPDAAGRSVGRVLDLRGPRLAPIAACATGVVAVLRAAELIRRGTCDLALAGATDSSLEPLVLGAFDRMRVMARVDGDPTRAVRPWDRGRSGFLVGEGGAVLVLEREDDARSRGVPPYAEVAGGALGSDAHHETNLDPDPRRLSSMIGEALRRADLAPGDVDHVNVHGTATRVNDPLECRAIRGALGRQADALSCSANKAQIGHLLGGAGAAELAITCLALRDQFVPPTLNLDDPDPACDLDGTPGIGRDRRIRSALKLSLGFGGHLAVVVLRCPDGPRRSGPPSDGRVNPAPGERAP